jgi:Glycosyl hydrolase family 99
MAQDNCVQSKPLTFGPCLHGPKQNIKIAVFNYCRRAICEDRHRASVIVLYLRVLQKRTTMDSSTGNIFTRRWEFSRASLILLLLCNLMYSCKKEDPHPSATATLADPQPVVKTNSQKVYVAYQAWFEDKNTSDDGNWGSHWTMASRDPNIIVAGKRQIASFFYPLIGPYGSSDQDVLDYHLLLMKYAGIDGVIVDWYGTHNVYDYPKGKGNADALVRRVPKAGLQFAITYEDATLKNVESIEQIANIPAARQDFKYLEDNYFNQSNYIRINEQPLMLCFGPQVLQSGDAWQQAFSELKTKPRLLSLEYQSVATGSAGSGEFAWVSSINPTHLQAFYMDRVPQLATAFAAAYPGFKDYYAQGGWGNNYPELAHNGTATLRSTLELAKANSSLPVQLITWNDFGEGTMLEPTLEFEFSLLETVQTYTGVKYTVSELQLIYKWFTLRKKYKGNAHVEQQLDDAYNDLVSLKVDDASEIISSIQ